MKTRGWAAATLPAMLLALSAANAGEPASSGLKVGIDPTTHKLRALTEEESAALDAAATRTTASAKAALASETQAGAPAMVSLPAQLAVPARVSAPRGGMAMKVPMSEMTHLVAKRDASGKVVITEEGGEGAAAAQEVLK